jgi:hypothetical protein
MCGCSIERAARRSTTGCTSEGHAASAAVATAQWCRVSSPVRWETWLGSDGRHQAVAVTWRGNGGVSMWGVRKVKSGFEIT